MDELMQVINKLQEVFACVGENLQNTESHLKLINTIELPQIVVVGAQSSGKSSVLESIVGRSFLPRGPGVVTRRPLVLQLIYLSRKELSRMANELLLPNLEAWGVFLHKPDKKFTKFDDIRQEIHEETSRVAGDQSDISSEPMILKIYSNSVNLTLVDLPGLTKVPVGDQPQDIEHRVRQLVLKYISGPHSIILAIVTANTDIVTSESLQLAKQVDPEGLRTLAVVTKLDIMDAGTDATEILNGIVIPVRLGIIGVINRSQRDIQKNKTLAQTLNDEAAFFRSKYPKLAAKHGTPYLSKVLQRVLLEHIRACLPEIRHKVSSLMNHYQSVLKMFGQPIQDKGQTLLHIITKFCLQYCNSIKGSSKDIETSELCGGARISYIFQESFGQALDSIHPLSGFNKTAILTAMRNASGTRPGLFVPEMAFELLVKRQIKRFQEPSLRCADLVHQELERVVQNSLERCNDTMSRFTNLHRKILEVCCEILRAQLPVAHTTITQLIAIQLAYINTNHPDFVRDANAISAWIQSIQPNDETCFINNQVNNRQKSNESCSSIGDSVSVAQAKRGTLQKCLSNDSMPQIWRTKSICATNTCNNNNNNEKRNQNNEPKSKPLKPQNINNSSSGIVRLIGDREYRDCIVIEHLIKSYFDIVKKSIQDNVPKAIMYCLVNHVMENLQQQLVCQLYKPEHLQDLLSESKFVTQQRKETLDVIKALDKSYNILNDIRDSHCLWPSSSTNLQSNMSSIHNEFNPKMLTN